MRAKRQKWEGGYVRKQLRGKPVYVIERWAHGRRVHVSTGCSTKEGARAELARFEADPLGYRPGRPEAGALFFTSELGLAYRQHQLDKGLTVEWADEVTRCLADWREELEGRDLRALRLHRDLVPPLDKWKTQRPHRIKALKGFFRWLRQERGLVTRAQDATLDLRVPQARPEKLTRRKVVPVEDVAAVLKRLPAVSRDVLHLLSGTAWHLSEVARFHAIGEIVQPLRQDGVLAVLITPQKSGELTKTPLFHKEHLETARRIQALKTFPKRMTLARHQRAACEAAGVPWFGMGQMRHSVLTWGVEDGGASIADAKEFAHHHSESTTKRFYLDLAVPKGAIPVYQLLD